MSDATPLARSKRITLYLAIAFLVAFTLVMAFDKGPTLDQIWDSWSFGLLMGLLALSSLNYLLRAARWQLLSLAQGIAIPWPRSLLYYLAGFATTLTPAKLGEASRLWLLRRGHGLAYHRTTSLMVADRLGDLAAVCLLALIALIFLRSHALEVIVAAVIVAAITALLVWPGAGIAVITKVHAWVGRAPRFFAGLRQALRLTARLQGKPVYWTSLFLIVLGWLAESAGFYWLLSAMGADISFVHALSIFCLASLAGALSLLPGGLVGAELSMVALLLAAGLDVATASAATATIRVTTLWFAVAVGFLTFPLATKLVQGPGDAPGSRARL